LKNKLKQLAKYIDDILFTLGVFFLSLSGFLVYIPAGFFILGVGLIVVALIIARAQKRGD
jgi:uncharacterized membrane protein